MKWTRAAICSAWAWRCTKWPPDGCPLRGDADRDDGPDSPRAAGADEAASTTTFQRNWSGSWQVPREGCRAALQSARELLVDLRNLQRQTEADVARATSDDARRHNLPAQLTSFVGRSQEIAEIRRLLSTHPAADADRGRRLREDAAGAAGGGRTAGSIAGRRLGGGSVSAVRAGPGQERGGVGA